MTLKEEPRHWDPEALRTTRWFSRIGKSRRAHSPFEDQEAFEGFVASLLAKIQPRLDHGLDERVQAEIAYLTRLLANMPRATIYRNRVFFEMAFDLLAVEHPNLELVTQLRQALGLGKFTAMMFGKTPIQTVMLGVFSSFILLFAAILLLDQMHLWLGTHPGRH